MAQAELQGQVRERVERGLRETEGGPKGEMLKTRKQGTASGGGEGEVGEEDALGRGVGGKRRPFQYVC